MRKKRKKGMDETEYTENIGKKVISIRDRRRLKPIYTGSGDFILSIFVIGLVIFGIAMVFSASYYEALNYNGSPYYYLKKDIFLAAIGGAAMIALASCDYHHLRKLSNWIILILLILFALLFFSPLGKEVNNARRWLDFKYFTIMPGELAKPAIIIFVAAFFSANPRRVRSFFRGIIPMITVAGIMFFLIYMQPNLSTAITVVLIIIGMMFIAGMHIGLFIGITITGAISVIGLLLYKGGFHLARIINFRHPEQDFAGGGYQVYQSLLSLGSGGLIGVGIGNSIQKNLYLPEPQNDFILAIIGEELGFIGILLLLTAYLVVIWRCVYIAIKAPDLFGRLLASGFSIMLAVHVIFNVLIVTAWMPPTGVILPFVSWGGNALVMFMACIGIMLNISRQSDK